MAPHDNEMMTDHEMWQAILKGYWYAYRAIAKDWEDLTKWEVRQVERDYMREKSNEV